MPTKPIRESNKKIHAIASEDAKARFPEKTVRKEMGKSKAKSMKKMGSPKGITEGIKKAYK